MKNTRVSVDDLRQRVKDFKLAKDNLPPLTQKEAEITNTNSYLIAEAAKTQHPEERKIIDAFLKQCIQIIESHTEKATTETEEERSQLRP